MRAVVERLSKKLSSLLFEGKRTDSPPCQNGTWRRCLLNPRTPRNSGDSHQLLRASLPPSPTPDWHSLGGTPPTEQASACSLLRPQHIADLILFNPHPYAKKLRAKQTSGACCW